MKPRTHRIERFMTTSTLRSERRELPGNKALEDLPQFCNEFENIASEAEKDGDRRRYSGRLLKEKRQGRRFNKIFAD